MKVCTAENLLDNASERGTKMLHIQSHPPSSTAIHVTHYFKHFPIKPQQREIVAEAQAPRSMFFFFSFFVNFGQEQQTSVYTATRISPTACASDVTTRLASIMYFHSSPAA